LAASEITPGLQGRASRKVEATDLASAYGNPGVEVMSSMTLMTLLEQAAIDAIAERIPPGMMSVGARMEMDHLAPTPEGFTVTATAELVQVKGPKMVFELTAHDGVEQVAGATHVRFLVPRDDFFQGVAAKQAGQAG